MQKVFGLIIVMALFLTIAVPVAARVQTTSVRIYHGPRQVYDNRTAFVSDIASSISRGKPAPENPLINKWAVVIGISDYRGVQYDLRYCDDDARDVYNYLISKGYPVGNIKLLLNSKATAKNIVAAIDWLRSKENSTSEVVFFYSGHGSTYDGYNDGDSEYTDEGIVSSDLYLILDGQLRQRFAGYESTKVSITFDSCFSGGMNDLTATGRVVVAACGENEYSYEDTTLQNGVFTYYYLSGLQTYNVVESAFTYAAPLAHDFVFSNIGDQMNPQMYDQYLNDWTF